MSRFQNPEGPDPLPSFAQIRKMLAAPRARWPRRIAVEPRTPPPLAGHKPAVTFIGHATFLIQSPLGNILTDPFFSERASPVQWIGPRRVRAPGVRLEDLPEITLLLLSHNHYDHCDLPALRALARRHDPVCLTPTGNGRLLRRAGFQRVEELAWWQLSGLMPLPVTLVPARHFSGRLPWDRNRALWGGFFIDDGPGRRILFAGDSGYGAHFSRIATRLGPPDIALLPIGAYEPRWFMRPIHMNPAEAVQAHLDLGARRSIAMHFGTIQLTPEAIDAPVQELAAARKAAGLAATDFAALEPGETE